MKGIVHFLGGVAWTSISPTAVNAAMNGNPLYFIAGGICGLLPDTIDFKLARFLHKSDILVVIDPLNPDPKTICDAFDRAFARSIETGKPVYLKLYTMRLASDLWRRYTVRFNQQKKSIEVQIGPVVDTGRNCIDYDEFAGKKSEVCLLYNFKTDYFASLEIDILDGPLFKILRENDKMVRVEFIPWHRKWSHGIVLSVLLFLCGWALLDVTLGIVMGGAHALHWIIDQLGYMGSNIWFPFSLRRIPGMKLASSGDAFANASVSWFFCCLIFWNLSFYSGKTVIPLNFVQFILLLFCLPVLIGYLLKKRLSLGKNRV